MRFFTLSDLNRKPGELVDKALVEPIVLTKHRRPQLVIMSAEQFEKLSGKTLKMPFATREGDAEGKFSDLKSRSSYGVEEPDDR